ncbi:MAG: hypothetical protein SOT70_10045 [Lachnospiraceae bacterium]|nr:hypothetical protein [Lachnospiraceae bacterium]
MIILKIIGICAIVLLAFFVLTFLIYFFNLDMKMAASLGPLLEKIYDHGEKKRKEKAQDKQS